MRLVEVLGWVFATAWLGIAADALADAGPSAGAPAKGEYRGAKSTEYPAWFKTSFLDLPADVAEAAKAGKRLMVLFYQDGCPYCNALVERNLAQRGIEDKVRKHLDVIALNLWGDREVIALDGKTYTEKTFGAALKVQFTPTVLFFDEQGKEALRLNGYLPPERFDVALDYVIGKQEKRQTFREYLAANAPRPSAGELIRQDFFSTQPTDLSKRTPGQPFAVFFEQKHCPDCERLHTSVLTDADTRAVIRQFHNVQLDMWADTPIVLPDGKPSTARDWAKDLGVAYAPTIIVFNPEGKEIIRSEAEFRTFHTQSIFDYVLSGAYKSQPSFQRYISARAEHLREQGKNVDIYR